MRFLRHSVEFIFCLSLCAPAFAQSTAAPPTDPATYSLITGRDPMLTMDGKWRFHPGDNPHYADPAFDDSHWALLDSDYSWFYQGYAGLSGYAWYRFRVILPAGGAPFKIALAPMQTSYQIFIDGRLVRTVGTMGGTWSYTTQPLVLPLSTASRITLETVTVAVRIWHAPEWARWTGGGPSYGTTTVGTAPQVDRQMSLFIDGLRLEDNREFGLGAFALLSGTTALILFIIRRTAREYVWFALLCLAFSANEFFSYFSDPYVMNRELWGTIYSLFGTLFQLALIFFVSKLFELRLSRLSRTAIVAVLLNFTTTLCCLWSRLLPEFALDWCVAGLGVVLYACLLAILARRSRRGDLDAKLLLFPISLFALVLVTGDILLAIFQIHGRGSLSLWGLRIQHPFTITIEDIASFLLFLGLLAILVIRFSRTSREQDRIAADLESARTLQQVLIPDTLPTIPGIAIATAYHPAQEVGGDFFQIIPLPSGDTLIVLGDVSGKGLPAAMTVSLIVGALRTIVEFTSSPADILAALNRRLHGRGSGFTTCVALRISPSGLLTIANAGHLAPYLNGEELETDAALPLGLDPELSLTERTRQTAPSDHLTLITDGVLEATDNEGKLFGFDRTLTSSVHAAGHIATLARDFGQSDDITVLTLDFA